MAKELGQAYVQIVPSARGIGKGISKELNGESAGTGESFGKSLCGKIMGVIATAGIGKAIAASIKEGAALQQSIGGVETMFKENADTVKAYAANAYKTAGLSANAYMEQVTGFSAALIKSMGGDTSAAAEAANQALTDMSDNANKFGTDMESIQNAYNGFSKQNYTMLDNLKLGYGGTKSEMQRLLKDAQELSGVKYDINNLSDVYEAIHVVQEEMGVTGTTAKEAATTFSGSFSAMKAAASNLLGNLALGEDISPALDGLMETVQTFLIDNLIPMVGNIIRSTPKLLSGVISGAVKMLNIAANNGDEIIGMGLQLISELAVGIISAAPYLIEAAVRLMVSLGSALLNTDWAGLAQNLISSLRDCLDIAGGEILGTDGNIIAAVTQSVTDNLPQVLDKGIEIITNLAGGILESIPTAITSMGEILKTLVRFIMENLPTILQAGVKLIKNLAMGLVNAIPDIVVSITKVLVDLLATIASHLPDLLQQGISLIGEMAAGIIQGVPDLLAKIPGIFRDIVDNFKEYDWTTIGKNIIDGIIKGIVNAATSLYTSLKNLAKNALQAAKNAFEIKSPSKLFGREVGHWLPPGIAVGAEQNAEPLHASLRNLALKSTDTMQDNLAVGVQRSSRWLFHGEYPEKPPKSNGGGYHQTVNIYSPKELSPSEVSRQTRNATKNMVLALTGG